MRSRFAPGSGTGTGSGIRPAGVGPSGITPGSAPVRDMQRPSDGNALWQKTSPTSDPARPMRDH